MALGYGRTGTNNFSTAKFIVDGSGLQTGATHTTIQGAIDDASAGDSILVRPGTYAEDITLKSNICLYAYGSQDAASGTVIVNGKITAGTTEFCYIYGLYLANASDHIFEDTGSTAGAITFDNCRFVGDGLNDMFVNSNSNRSLVIHFSELSQPSGAKVLDHTAGTSTFRYCVFSAGSSTISTVSAGSLNFSSCLGAFPFQTSGTANFTCNDTTVSSDNQICIDSQGSGGGIMQINSLRTNGTVAGMNIGAGSTVVTTQLDINTNNNTPISGAGSIWYDSVGFIQGGNHTIAPTTLGGATRIGLLRLGTALDETYGGTGQTTYAAGDILYASASNTLSKLAAGTDGHVLTLASGVPSWAAAGGGGAWELISTATASASATIDFTDLTSSYFMYNVVISGIAPATDGVDLEFRTSTDNGSTYDSGAGEYAWANLSSSGGFEDAGGSDSDTKIVITDDNMGNGTNEDGAFSVYIINPSAADFTKIIYSGIFTRDSGAIEHITGGGYRKSAADVDAIRFKMTSGNIATGTFKLYGLAAS